MTILLGTAAGTLSNTAAIGASTLDPVAANNLSTASTVVGTPVVAASRTSVTFAAPAGGTPMSQTVSITNAGSGTLNWTASVAPGAPWLSVGPPSGTASPS